MLELRGRILRRVHALLTPTVKRFLRRGVWSLADHALMSATNFITIVLLARVLSPQEFGLYALIYTVLLFANGMQSALITYPLTMLGATRKGQDFVQYATITAVLQVTLGIIAALLIATTSAVAYRLGWSAAPLLLACSPATAAWQMQEFVRRVLYIEPAVSKVFMNDLVSYGGQLGLIVLLWRSDWLTAITAIGALGITSFLGVLLGIWQIRTSLGGLPPRRQFQETTAANWNFGKWLVGSHLATWTSNHIYSILAAGFVSVTAAGAIKITQTILGPMNVLTFAQSSLLGPKTAQVYAKGGTRALRTFVGWMQLFVLCTVGVYCLLVSIFAEPILERVYGPAYVNYAWLLVIMAFTYAFAAFRGPLSLALTAVGETSAIFRVRLSTSAVNLTLGLAAVYFLGLVGVSIGLILNGLVLQIVTWHFYLQSINGKSPFSMSSPPCESNEKKYHRSWFGRRSRPTSCEATITLKERT